MIRGRQRVLTAIVPHNGNRRYVVPKRVLTAHGNVVIGSGGGERGWSETVPGVRSGFGSIDNRQLPHGQAWSALYRASGGVVLWEATYDSQEWELLRIGAAEFHWTQSSWSNPAAGVYRWSWSGRGDPFVGLVDGDRIHISLPERTTFEA
jgi:hypothetical protein